MASDVPCFFRSKLEEHSHGGSNFESFFFSESANKILDLSWCCNWVTNSSYGDESITCGTLVFSAQMIPSCLSFEFSCVRWINVDPSKESVAIWWPRLVFYSKQMFLLIVCCSVLSFQLISRRSKELLPFMEVLHRLPKVFTSWTINPSISLKKKCTSGQSGSCPSKTEEKKRCYGLGWRDYCLNTFQPSEIFPVGSTPNFLLLWSWWGEWLPFLRLFLLLQVII